MDECEDIRCGRKVQPDYSGANYPEIPEAFHQFRVSMEKERKRAEAAEKRGRKRGGSRRG